MNGIIEWYSAFAPTEQVFWACAIIGSVIFLIQLVCTLIGMDASDVEVDFDGANTLDMGGGMSLFSVRALVNFLVGFGWAGVSLRPMQIGPDGKPVPVKRKRGRPRKYPRPEDLIG